MRAAPATASRGASAPNSTSCLLLSCRDLATHRPARSRLGHESLPSALRARDIADHPTGLRTGGSTGLATQEASVARQSGNSSPNTSRNLADASTPYAGRAAGSEIRQSLSVAIFGRFRPPTMRAREAAPGRLPRRAQMIETRALSDGSPAMRHQRRRSIRQRRATNWARRCWSSTMRNPSRSAARRRMVSRKLLPRSPYTQLVRSVERAAPDRRDRALALELARAVDVERDSGAEASSYGAAACHRTRSRWSSGADIAPSRFASSASSPGARALTANAALALGFRRDRRPCTRRR